MHVRKRTGPFERRHTAAPTLAGSASRTTTGQDVVSGGSTRRPLGVASRRGVSVRLVAGIGAALVALAAAGTFGLRGGSAQASVAPANSVMAFGAAPTLGTPGVKPVASFVGIAATASGLGYWVAAEDGGVFAFGDAAFYGSAGTKTLYQPIVGIAATPSGRGYWLVGRDGGVFAFGDAPFLGSVARLDLGAAVVGIAATPSHEGYWLVAADGGVFSFGDATFAGSEASTTVNDATGIAAGRTGYWIARAAGAVRGFGTGLDQLGVAALVAPGAATVGIAPQAGGGFWTVQGAQAPPAVTVDHMNPFLVCTRSHESSHTPPAYDNGYAAVNPSGTYRGAYQFSQSTWNNAALRAGRLDLVGIDPAAASVADQDLLALDLYHWQGAGPWMGRCSGL
jgi:hypothetical protein